MPQNFKIFPLNNGRTFGPFAAFSRFLQEHAGLHRVLLLTAVSLLTAYGLSIKPPPLELNFQVGDLVTRFVRADADYQFNDDAATRLLQNEASRLVPPIFDYNPGVLAQLTMELDALLVPRTDQPSALGAFVHSLPQRDAIHDELGQLSRDLLAYRYVVDTPEYLSTHDKTGIEVRNVDQPETAPKYFRDVEGIVDIQTLRQEAQRRLQNRLLKFTQLTAAQQQQISAAYLGLLKSNLSYNLQATEARKKLVGSEIKPVTISVRRGEVLLKPGERVSHRHQFIIEKILAQRQRNTSGFVLIGNALLVFLAFGLLAAAAEKFLRDFRPAVRDYYLIAALLLLGMVFYRFWGGFSEKLANEFPLLGGGAMYYMLPFAFGTMLVQMVLNGTTALIFTVANALLCAAVFSFSWHVAAFSLLSSIFGALIVERFQTRTGLFKAAMLVAAFNVMLLAIYNILQGSFHFNERILTLGMLLLCMSAILHFIVLSLLTPIIEHFDYITDMKLVELANFNNPLLNKLALEAPGTYHHSRVVAQLVEAAAESIGARPLLAMVMALYHDIGKTKAPQYFTENQDAESRGIHDKLKPSMSRMIIVAHIKDGIDMAKRAGLPTALINAIPEHHGTSLITFFYHKAKDLEDPSLGSIDENDYRYPGPKPRSKETALLMLADSVEAATKALPEPTAEKIQGVIQKIFNKYFSDGQLGDCDLTLNDLNRIAKSFHRTLASVYKPRVEYPEVVPSSGGTQKVKKQDAGRVQQPSKDAPNRPQDGDDDDGEDLKRLGM